ncbi:MAG: toll/interleukin-1 receptor domain-containing protein [Acidobacteria bacterium]|nr:toll/interleukin-1 receptor domain-containing protein [Acidobacteriota bacterium]
MATAMNIFISWSGSESRPFAEKLKKWLPEVIQALKPWMSAVDIASGARPANEIAEILRTSTFGILCITPENNESKWIHFEAGAISKAIEGTRVIPICIRMKPSDLKPPLAWFQGKEASREDVHRLVADLNALVLEPLPTEVLDRAFERNWPDLEAELQRLPSPGTRPEPRTLDDKVDEILTLLRSQADRFSAHPIANLVVADPSTRDLIAAVLERQFREIGFEMGLQIGDVRPLEYAGSRWTVGCMINN